MILCPRNEDRTHTNRESRGLSYESPRHIVNEAKDRRATDVPTRLSVSFRTEDTNPDFCLWNGGPSNNGKCRDLYVDSLHLVLTVVTCPPIPGVEDVYSTSRQR